MDEDQILAYFESLPLEQRIKVVRTMLADMESRLAAVRAALDGSSVNPEAKSSRPVPSEGGESDSGKENASPAGEPAKGQGGRASSEGDPDLKEKDEWEDFDLDSITGGSSHIIHRMRLLDAAAHYEHLLKKYGYVKGIPDPGELLRRQGQSRTVSKKPSWAEWVARDQAEGSEPEPREWQDWVARDSPEGEKEP